MAVAVLVIELVWAALAFGWRAVVQRRRTGDSGFRGFGGSPRSIEWWAGLLFVLALGAAVVAPIADLAGAVRPIGWLDETWIAAVGVGVALLGVVGTLGTQLAMGDSWRVGVDQDERTELVTAGPFTLARNPIYTMMLLTTTGLVLMVPNLIAIAGLVGLTTGLELQVRFVEEPYLRRTHGRAYAAYAARVGRFLPGLGRLTPDPQP